VNGIGLISLSALIVAIQLLAVGIATGNILSIAIGVPFAVVGLLGLTDDIVLNERITKKLLGLE
jgi:hypothetical protein